MIKNTYRVFIREVKKIFTNKDLLLICFAAPIFYGLLFSYLYINKRAVDLNISMSSYENTAQTRKLIRSIDASPEMNIIKTQANPYDTYEDILEDKADGFYFIPRNFSKNLKKGRQAVAIDGVNASNFMVSSAILKKLFDIASQFPKQTFTKTLVQNGFSYQSAQTLFHPLRTDSRYIFNSQMNYSDFLLPALLLAVLQQILLVAVCSSLSGEKKNNTQKELYETAGMSFTALFIGKIFPYIFVGSILNIMNIFIMLPINDIYASSMISLFIVSTAFIIAILSFAILISAFFKSPETALAALMFYSLPTFLMSGFAWPHYAFPLYLQIFSLFFPSTYAVNHIRMLTLGGIDLQYSIFPTLSLLTFALICYFAARLVERKTRKIFDLEG
ncbi:MAG: ABC transporter permease [Elusimicrobiota bacterium]|jgi:ABC-2 type transport system permease protein|nr:ABC transporter permease [Elusimicrobiota bacterium]